ncbi:MAG TPA: hypothetical protein VLH86_05355 [Patescibacteria group bacterium]|nr:hypothetical protein [Patescibacteria group bacterium]
MCTVENLAAQATDVLLQLPIAELTSAAGVMEQAGQLAADATAETDSLGASAMNEHLADAQAHLAAGICALEAADTAFRGYLAGLGTAPPAGTNSPSGTSPETELGPDRYEAAMAEIEDFIHVDVDDEMATSPDAYRMNRLAEQYGPLLREALTTKHRDRALQLLERLVNYVDPFNPGFATHSRESVRAGGSTLAAGACGAELAALARQTADPELAQRAARLLFNSFAREIAEPDPEAVRLVAETFADSVTAVIEDLDALHARDWARYYDADRVGELSQRRYTEAAENISAAAEQVLHHLSDEDKGSFLRTIIGIETDYETSSIGHQILKNLFNGDRGRKSFITATGLVVSDIEHAWAVGYGQENEKDPTPGEIRSKNLWLMYDLEKSAQGTCAALNRKLNLSNFERVSPAALRIARAALDKPPASYILFATVTRSKNPAMRMRYRDLDAMNAVARRHGTVVIPIEFGSEADLRKIRQGLRADGWGQAEHLIINAHSDNTRLGAGVDTAGNDIFITSDDILQPGYHSIGRIAGAVVKEGGTISMLSCRAGEGGAGSLAHNVAYASRRTTFAADQKVTSKVTLEEDPITGKLVPTPSYKGEDGPVAPVRFDP